MEKYFGEKQERFSFRKLSVGLVSATISSLFFMSVLASSSVDAQETAGMWQIQSYHQKKRSSLSMIFRHTWRMMMKLIILFIS
ncbi:immunoglobulin A1 protease [Streptococcus pneumoniae]|nr:immunoglobulin A1 protease [Streptococcus pneumoniae]VNT81370.1 immunoglobulin A1 protease [Streptococcus pneumoniae]